MSKAPVLVIGATGTVGREVVKALLARGEHVQALVRAPARAARQLRGVELLPGDLEQPTALRAAMGGARAAFFVTAHGPREEEHGLAVIAAAEAAGLERLVYSAAWRFWSPNPFFDRILATLQTWLSPHYGAKIRLSRRLMKSRLSHVVLWPTNFFQNDVLVRSALAKGTYVQPLGAKPVNRVDVRDIALATARAMSKGLVKDGAWPVVGPESSSGAEYAAHWSRALGRPVGYEDDLEQWGALIRDSLTADTWRDWQKTFRLIQRYGIVSPERDLALTTQLLGQAPRRYDAWVAEQARGLRATATAA